MKKMYIYILHCADDSFYTGVTNNLERRLNEHIEGIHEDSYTYSRRPLKLVHHEIFNGPLAAIDREKQIKGWSRKKKLALINSKEEDLVGLSKKDFS